MSPVIVHAVIPAENPAVSGQSLNVLVVTENPTGAALRRPVRFWGSDGGPWRELLREERVFPPHSHPHLYFNLPAACFAPALWGGEAPEELSIAVGGDAPATPDAGVLVFFQ